MKKDKPNRRERFALTFKLNAYVIIIIATAVLMIGVASIITDYLFRATGVIIRPVFIVLIILGESTLITGLILVPLLSKFVLGPINNLIHGLDQVAKGNFDKRLEASNKSFYKNVYDNFNKMAQELSTTETLRNDFVQNFSHEFKTPIVSIQGFAKMLRNPNLTESERQEYLDIVLDESKRLVDLSNNTLMLTKLETQELISMNEEYSLDEQIRQCVLQLENMWSLKRLEMDIELEQITVEGNSDLSRQLYVNLINNAIKFSDDQESIQIRLRRENNNAVFTITDHGCGISSAALPHIFDKYYQEDVSHMTAGNGLGLSIVKRICQMTGCKIEVESEKGQGTTFTVITPIKRTK